ncbi:MAG: anthranilate synthase component I [Candidatus Margulisiibacteriota bacterium]
MNAQKQVLVPIIKELVGDLDTPVSLYLKLNRAQSFLLESVTGGENVARYSFIGVNPFCTFTAQNDTNTIDDETGTRTVAGNPLDILENLIAHYHMDDAPHLPPFLGGAVGYFSWETIRHIEAIALKNKPSIDGIPEIRFFFPKGLVVFDHVKRKIILVALAKPGEEKAAQSLLEELETAIQKPLSASLLSLQKPDNFFDKTTSSLSQPDFEAMIEAGKRHIFEGDVFQLVLSQRFETTSAKKPFDIYRTLRTINPSPYMYYIDDTDYQIIGSSPEILVKVEHNQATVRPIAGTRPRPPKDQEDAVIAELKADEKEVAEHIMLVDLGRNDLGRVCDYNSVKTAELMTIERYSHVFHMVTNVTGTLQQGKTAMDVFKATFPAGTVSGAPKIRAIEIIDALEPTGRKLYAGALGYFDFRGNMDLCIIIRTILAKNNHLYVQAGAGIVADSNPATEFVESQNKAKGMIEACL